MKAKVMFLAVLACVVGLAGLAQAQVKAESVDISFMGGGIFPNKSINLDNGIAYGLGVGYNFTENWEVELFGHLASLDNKTQDRIYGGRLYRGGGDSDVALASLSALYNFDTGTRFVPYVSLGLGGQWVSRDTYPNYNSFAVNGGLGVKVFLNEYVALRVEASDALGLKKNDGGHFNAPIVSAGLTFQLAGNKPCLDSDSDGVCDTYDKCPGTPAGYKVDADGCPLTTTIRLEIKFDFDKSVVKPIYKDEVKKVADFMTSHPETDTVVEGHTDGKGSDEYNLKLSQRRADAVRDYLIKNFNVSPSRVQAVGYGKTQPIATNDTDAGRAQNRRVVGVISGASLED